MRDASAAGFGVVAGVGLAAAAWYALIESSGAAAQAVLALLLLGLVAVIVAIAGKTSVRSARAVVIGLAGYVVASFAVYFMVLAAQGKAIGLFVVVHWAALAAIGVWATLSARRATASGMPRDVVTAVSAALFTALLVSGAFVSYALATFEPT